MISKKKKLKFSKIIVISCIVALLIYTVLQTILSHSIGAEITPVLTEWFYKIFGLELLATALIRIFDKDEKKTTSRIDETSDYEDLIEG